MLRLMIWFGVQGKRHNIRARKLAMQLNMMGIGSD